MSETPNKAAARIYALLDANSFVEIGGLVTARSTDFNLSGKKVPSDGVVTGYGTVNGDLVYVYSQDPGALNGTIGEMHAKKITNIYRMAQKMGAPVVGLIDCKGVRLEESTDALAALGSIYRMQARLSGVIPQIIGIFGTCAGGVSFIPAGADFVFMEDDKARLFVNSPDAIEGSSREVCDPGKAAFQAEAGNVDFAGTEEEIFAGMRALLGFLPCNFEDDGYSDVCEDDLNRATADIKAYSADTLGVLSEIADDHALLEVGAGHGKGVITAFLRLNGTTIGAIANRKAYSDEEGNVVELGSKLCPCGTNKAAKFISFCDAFSIPVLTVASVEGFKTKLHVEEAEADAASRLIYAYAGATVPKVTLYIGNNYGSAAVIMGSKAVGADMVYAWADARIGAMDARSAAKIISRSTEAAAVKDTETEYGKVMTAEAAASRGYVDTVIEEASTRKYVIGAFEMLYSKREVLPDKKHGTK